MQEFTCTHCGDDHIPNIYLYIESRPIDRWGRDRKLEAAQSKGMGRNDDAIRNRAEKIVIKELVYH